jgi:hypothetical protein
VARPHDCPTVAAVSSAASSDGVGPARKTKRRQRAGRHRRKKREDSHAPEEATVEAPIVEPDESARTGVGRSLDDLLSTPPSPTQAVATTRIHPEELTTRREAARKCVKREDNKRREEPEVTPEEDHQFRKEEVSTVAATAVLDSPLGSSPSISSREVSPSPEVSPQGCGRRDKGAETHLTEWTTISRKRDRRDRRPTQASSPRKQTTPPLTSPIQCSLAQFPPAGTTGGTAVAVANGPPQVIVPPSRSYKHMLPPSPVYPPPAPPVTPPESLLPEFPLPKAAPAEKLATSRNRTPKYRKPFETTVLPKFVARRHPPSQHLQHLQPSETAASLRTDRQLPSPMLTAEGEEAVVSDCLRCRVRRTFLEVYPVFSPVEQLRPRALSF